MKDTLIVDIRTPYQIKKFLEIEDYFKEHKVILILNHKIKFTKDLERFNFLYYKFSESNYMSVLVILRFLFQNFRYKKQVSLLTACNFGPFFLCLKFFFRLQKCILFEDGLATFCNFSSNFFGLKKKRFLYLQNYDLAFISILKKSFLPKNIKKIKFYGSRSCSVVERQNKDIVFLSSSAVEYRLQTLTEYQQILHKVSRLHDIDEIYVSFHHNEIQHMLKFEILKQYFPKIKIINKDIPFEEYMSKYQFKNLIAPYNTSALNALAEKSALNIFLYDDGGPYIERRKEFFQSIEAKNIFFI